MEPSSIFTGRESERARRRRRNTSGRPRVKAALLGGCVELAHGNAEGSSSICFSTLGSAIIEVSLMYLRAQVEVSGSEASRLFETRLSRANAIAK
jgi:hypothetical protein